MKLITTLIIALALVSGCGGVSDESAEQPPASSPGITLNVKAPEPLPVPEQKAPESDTDWESKVHNKDIEIIQVLNIINPVAAYITEGFNQYSNRFSPTLHEEWEDTQAQLTKALNLYEDCKGRRKAGKIDKQLFLDMEEVWQLLVKTGVAGVRTKSMVDSELAAMTR
ncbi:MAG: hypothetical protein GTO51_03260 [Candidatus Latescibacteria bacterium]|nr:hypothetical protein [Candidatus Latescibacterota bacterium]NIM22704.1 hypothetical protein [Candidatus Latescibacterota bacterium]NIM64993.1 hypothetical protein [Candidatus Latescibacterota bacterium]NIO01508.1 hypothetical protein [Candidatus Latescibacterota bacterium]NIO28017.1 hypothetical protein [Candidatus Latescibacterota bacterium]